MTHRSAIKLPLLLTLLAVGVVSCTGGPDPARLYEDVRTAMAEVESYRFEGHNPGSPSTNDTVGEFVAPDRWHVRTDEGGLAAVRVGETYYMRQQEGGEWRSVDVRVGVGDMPKFGDEVPQGLVDLALVSEDAEVIGVPVYHLRGIRSDPFPGDLSPSMDRGDVFVVADLYIGRNNDLLYRVVEVTRGIVGYPGEDVQIISNVMMSTFFDFNADLTIEPPEPIDNS